MLDRAIDGSLDETANRPTAFSDLRDVEVFAYLSPRYVKQALGSLVGQAERARRAVSQVDGYGAERVIAINRHPHSLRIVVTRVLLR